MDGFCVADVKPLGPVQVYVAPEIVVEERLSVEPAQIGALLDGTGAAGIARIATTVVPAGPVQPLTVAATVYVPAAADVALGIDGDWLVELNPFGPVHV
jgi:hypothetical protein